ncbi:MAG: class I SAM-dependent methyltransferase [Pseudomonadales bacterium]|nr:class I SAM-dependent methyltransferase [Pseudomonadales bacterium]
MSGHDLSRWDERYAQDGFVFGKEASEFLKRQGARLLPGQDALAVADGEGRNGVWLAEQGLHVTSVEGSQAAQVKARQLAAERQVNLNLVHADLLTWDWPVASFDVVVAIFIQFAKPVQRQIIFERMVKALRPGGLLLLHGYGLRQLEFRTGGPSEADQLYTLELMQDSFLGLEILELCEYEAEVSEGHGHLGRSALIDLVVRRP